MGNDPPPPPNVAFSAGDIEREVSRIGAEISAAHADGVLVVGVLKGCLIFLSDLARHLTVDVEFDLLAISRFAPDSGRVKLLKDVESDIAGRSVVLVEVVVDTGLSVGYLAGQLRSRGASSVEICTLLDKDTRRILPVELAYVGFTAPDAYLLGYGLDYEGRYRNLNDVVVADLHELEENPDVYLPAVYGSGAG